MRLDRRGLALIAALLFATPAVAGADGAARSLWGTLVIEGADEGVALSGPAAGRVRAILAQGRAPAPHAARTLADHVREYRWRAETARDLEQLSGQGPATGFAPRF